MTEKASVSIKHDWLKKIEEESFSQGKSHWAVAFNFMPGGCNYYIISEQDLVQLNQYLKGESE